MLKKMVSCGIAADGIAYALRKGIKFKMTPTGFLCPRLRCRFSAKSHPFQDSPGHRHRTKPWRTLATRPRVARLTTTSYLGMRGSITAHGFISSDKNRSECCTYALRTAQAPGKCRQMPSFRARCSRNHRASCRTGLLGFGAKPRDRKKIWAHR